jgi:hypothetical protein
MGQFIDMTGWVMSEHGVPDSRLTVIKKGEDYIGTNGEHYAMWTCRCSCGNPIEFDVFGSCIRSGHTRSCGCLLVEFRKSGKAHKKENKIEYRDDYCVGYTSNTNREFYFDKEDEPIVRKYCWCEKEGYVKTHDPITKKTKSLHKEITGYELTDHIDRNPMNNRRYNLRPATQFDNSKNASIPKNNTSGYIGVSWNRQKNKWNAYIMVNYKKKNLGTFVNKEDAIIARLKAEKEYFADGFEPQRHLFEQYGII